MKNMLFVGVAVAGLTLFTGCGGGDTYVAEGPAAPEIPTDTGQALIVQASDDSSAGLSYTEVGDGSILVNCGDGDGYGCEVYTGSQVTSDGEASTAGGCSSGNCP